MHSIRIHEKVWTFAPRLQSLLLPVVVVAPPRNNGHQDHMWQEKKWGGGCIIIIIIKRGAKDAAAADNGCYQVCMIKIHWKAYEPMQSQNEFMQHKITKRRVTTMSKFKSRKKSISGGCIIQMSTQGSSCAALRATCRLKICGNNLACQWTEEESDKCRSGPSRPASKC